MICEKCGATLPENATFCGECGAKVVKKKKNPAAKIISGKIEATINANKPLPLIFLCSCAKLIAFL